MKIKVFDSELRVMEILWKNGEMSARDIAHLLEEEVGWNVNTTYTTIKKLIAKNAIKRHDPKFRCTPLITKADVQKQEARELSGKLFGGSPSALLSAFLTDNKIPKSEITRMKNIIDLLDETETEESS